MILIQNLTGVDSPADMRMFMVNRNGRNWDQL